MTKRFGLAAEVAQARAVVQIADSAGGWADPELVRSPPISTSSACVRALPARRLTTPIRDWLGLTAMPPTIGGMVSEKAPPDVAPAVRAPVCGLTLIAAA